MPDAPRRFITRWDLDKTYLRTRFDTLSELVESAIEGAEDKRTVPGATAVLRELGVGGGFIHILSGSPRQMRRKLEAKLRLDGVSWDELTLKPNLSNLLTLRLSALRDQLGYKLPELLEARARNERELGAPSSLREVLVGDDSESDAFVYSLYADLCAGKVPRRVLERVLKAGHVRSSASQRCLAALPALERGSRIDCILIHLDAQTPPSLFAHFGTRLVPFYNYLQAAFVLLERGFLSERSALSVAAEFARTQGFSPDTVVRSYLDLARRGYATLAAPELLLAALAREPPELAAGAKELGLALAAMRTGSDSVAPRSFPIELDYVALAERHRGGRNRRRPGQRFG